MNIVFTIENRDCVAILMESKQHNTIKSLLSVQCGTGGFFYRILKRVLFPVKIPKKVSNTTCQRKIVLVSGDGVLSKADLVILCKLWKTKIASEKNSF